MSAPISFTSKSARFGLPFLFAGQAQKEFYINEGRALTDILLHPSILGELDAPPQDPVDGDCWLISSAATGDWAGHDADLAGWQAGIWTFVKPSPGMRVFDNTTKQVIHFSNTWERINPPAEPSGGATIDSEARAAIINLIESLRNSGIFPVT